MLHVTIGMTQSQHCSNDVNVNDDNVMCASVWFEFFGNIFLFENLSYLGGKRDNKE